MFIAHFFFRLHMSFFLRYKLERGSLTAFKREARNIIERDLPLILHRDNIIKVWTDKVCLIFKILSIFELPNF